jgi:hypothetical protein
MSRDRQRPRFRHRIKDLMILNAVLAITLALSMALNNAISNKIKVIRALVAGLVALPFLMVVIVGPLALVEMYLYRKKKGTWYRMQNPAKPRPRYQRLTDLPPFDPRMPVPSFLEEPPSQPQSRTRLFEASSASEPVSRASILLNVASRFEASGRMDAAAKVYHQILERFPNAAEARDAAHRLRLLTMKKDHAPDV